MLRILSTFILAVLLLNSNVIFSQTYQGPSTGSVTTGAVVNTNSFADFPISNDSDPIIRGEMNLEGLIGEPMIIPPDGKEIFPTTYTEDLNVGESTNLVGDNAMLLQKFIVDLDNNVIPPDPTIAVGPNHVMVLTNNGVGIRIYDKQGTLLKSISSNSFWSAVWPTQDGDPQIIYDHFAGRWVMVFMQIDNIAFTAGNLIAYSDDDNPLGTWYMYRLDTKLHGTTTSNTWGDYPQIGFDEQAVYIMTRCFTYGTSGSFQYTKIRIISKAELYASNAGTLSYKDLWDITIPGQSTRPDVIHPSFHYDDSTGVHYLLYASRSGANFYSLYKITNPITSPVLSGVNINVPFFGPTPDARQLGGGTVIGDTIAANGSHIKTAPIFRDGFLYAVHSMRNSVYPGFASIKYVKIDVGTNTVVESAELGANGYFYIYPSLAVDKNGNVGITCSRSALTEYIGAYFTTRRASDPAGLGNSQVLQPGLGKYVITFGGTRNRWGDYLGVYIDPADEYSFWMLSQYASGTNAYDCVVGQVRLEPFPGAHVFSEDDFLDFGDTEVGYESEEKTIILKNYGDSDWIINDIPNSANNFLLTSSHSLPITIAPFDSIMISLKFVPSDSSFVDDYYLINNNSSNFTGIRVKAIGYKINPIQRDKIYAISGEQNLGNTVLIDKITGTGNNLGESGYTSFISNAINPKTKVMYALESNSSVGRIYRINGSGGDAYYYKEISIPNLYSMVFDTSGQLYANTVSGTLYTINLDDTGYTQISQIPVQRVALTVNPITNEFWGSVKNVLGVKDRIIRINHLTGDTSIVGQTGFNINTNSLVFDANGNLYGITGTSSSINNFISIDTSNGLGTIIGSTNLVDLKSIATTSSPISEVSDGKKIIPAAFELSQNYPNPFNPSTQIKFALPVNANVKITIYNLLGEVVKQLTAMDMNAGTHSVQWNADDVNGNKVSSGIYFYELNAGGVNGTNFNQVRKMMLLK